MTEALDIQTIRLTVNGRLCTVKAHPMSRLIDVLREDLNLTGTKEGCGEGECGACAVIMDGLLILSCITPVCHAAERSITTIEGIPRGHDLHPLQQAFCERGGAQCGICTPGMLIAAAYYCDHPGEAEDMREALAGNQCRCTGYVRIFESVKAAQRIADCRLRVAD